MKVSFIENEKSEMLFIQGSRGKVNVRKTTHSFDGVGHSSIHGHSGGYKDMEERQMTRDKNQ